MTNEDSARPRCFVAMPITTGERHAEQYGDDAHWVHVMESLHFPAVRAAGFEPVDPRAGGSTLIHENIISNLEHCEMVLVDLSGDNPNVFFELGVRTSLDLPIALVWDGETRLPFDTSGINTHHYDSAIPGWKIDTEREAITRHIEKAVSTCNGRNPLWAKFGWTMRASEPPADGDPTTVQLKLLSQKLDALQDRLIPIEMEQLIGDSNTAPRTIDHLNETIDLLKLRTAEHDYKIELFLSSLELAMRKQNINGRVQRGMTSEVVDIFFNGEASERAEKFLDEWRVKAKDQGIRLKGYR